MRGIGCLAALVAVLVAAPAGAASPAPEQPAAEDKPKESNSAKDDKKAEALATLANAVSGFLNGLSLGAYVQGQYEHHQDSQDEQQNGVLLNQNRFVLRRARLKLDWQWKWASLMAELDGNSVKGPAFGLQHAEASVLWRGGHPIGTPPVLALTAGLFDVPFGYELTESPRARYFVERSLLSRSFFPAEPDLGVRVAAAVKWFRLSVAVMNGEPLGEKSGFALRAPVSAKTFVARAGTVFAAAKGFGITAGASLLNGKGFHSGTDPTKAGVVWKDANENGQIDPGEIVAVPSQAGTPSDAFHRWAVAGDLRLDIDSVLGRTTLMGEVTVGSNMDRGLFVADPTLTGIDAREMGFLAGITQEVTKYGVVGFRYDQYDPNADSQDRLGGKLLPVSQTVRSFSPLVGLVLPERARLLFQYDFIRDKLARDERGVPADLKNDTWTVRLQVQL